MASLEITQSRASEQTLDFHLVPESISNHLIGGNTQSFTDDNNLSDSALQYFRLRWSKRITSILDGVGKNRQFGSHPRN
jgi:hypothetical protein